jgi:hypothetical protein
MSKNPTQKHTESKNIKFIFIDQNLDNVSTNGNMKNLTKHCTNSRLNIFQVINHIYP